jgi:hypothetical protein
MWGRLLTCGRLVIGLLTSLARTDIQPYLALGIPVLAILTSLIGSLAQVSVSMKTCGRCAPNSAPATATSEAASSHYGPASPHSPEK